MKQYLLIIITLLLSIPAAIAETFEYSYGGQTLTYAVLDEGAKTCEIWNKEIMNPSFHRIVSGALTIPKKVYNGKDEYIVTQIGDFAFSGSCDMTSVTIPNTITSIHEQAFYHCCSLTEITIPNSVTTIEGSAFSGCSGLTSITLPNSIKMIEGGLFEGCSSLTSVTIPNSVMYIDGEAFRNCTSLISVTIPNSVIKIYGDAFMSCSSLESIIIPNSVTWIGKMTFYECSSLKNFIVADGSDTLFIEPKCYWLDNVKNLYMGRNISYYHDDEFYPEIYDINFPAVNELTVGNQVTEIGPSMFANCSDLKKVSLGNSLTTISDNAFSDCTLTELVLPPSVETIGASAFAGNTDLATIIMGHNVKTIGEKAYDGCAAQTISITAQTPPTAPDNTFSNYTGRLWVPNAQAVENYYNAYTCWNRFSAYSMIEPEAITIEGEKTIDAAPGTVIRLTATITPENVTLPHIFWRSTDPAIATVDNDGVVTVHGEQPEYAAYATYAYGDEQTPGQCRIIAESLYANGPLAEVVINSDISAIDDITSDRSAEKTTVDYSQPYDVYNMQGIRIGDSTTGLLPGFYIIHQGAATAKIAIR